jgi:hypothetical protein
MQQTSQVGFGQRDDEIQAFPPRRANEPLTEGIRLRTLGRGFQHFESRVAYAVVERRREDSVSIMDEEAIRVVRWNRFTQLQQRPARGGMRCDTDVEETAGRVFHEHKDVEEMKRRRHRDTEVAGDDGLRMIPHKGPPVLGRQGHATPVVQALGHILAYRTW